MRSAFASGSLATKAVAAVVIAAFALTATPSEAKSRKRQQVERSEPRKSRTVDTGTWHYGSSAIVVDANTGKTLYEQNADALRHPASVTKVMTLYLLFEQMEAGRLKLTSALPVSAKAASQSPSKLNVRPGSSIQVDDAIKAIVTRSANDVAVVIAEAVGGTESHFAEMMTDKARALGMTRTTFRNASGLPNPQQVTTARDLAILGRAIQDRFPKEYRYFSTRSFVYKGETIGSHNRLVGRIEGVDGIKTGYTQASGFNLVTSIHRDDRFLVAVVLGGRSASSRDARMVDLIQDQLPRAYAGARTAPKVVEMASRDAAPRDTMPGALARQVRAAPEGEVAPLPEPRRLNVADSDPVETSGIPPKGAVAPGSAEPIRPMPVRTVAIQRPVNAQVASAGTFVPSSGMLGYAPSAPAPLQAAAPAPAAPQAAPQPVAAAPSAKDGSRYQQGAILPQVAHGPAPQAHPAQQAHTLQAQATQTRPVQPPQAVAQPVRTAALTAPVARATARDDDQKPRATERAAAARSGWMIQIGAFGGEREARSKLEAARAKAKSVLGDADPFTEKVSKGSSDLYRARFAGLSEKDAKAACRLLQRNDFACMTIRN